jgi:hypothetical protein
MHQRELINIERPPAPHQVIKNYSKNFFSAPNLNTNETSRLTLRVFTSLIELVWRERRLKGTKVFPSLVVELSS